MKAAVIYIRVSSDPQVKGTSLATQEADCRAWCARNGYIVAAVYREEGESAKTADRPELIAAVAHCKRAKIAALVVHKMDRFARNSRDGEIIRASLRASGCRLASATEGITDDDAGEMFGTILLAIAQFDNRVRAARCRRGMEAVALAGGWVHKAPLGFILRKEDGRIPVLEPDPGTAPQVADLYRKFADGLVDQVTVARELGASAQQACRLLRNPVYAGIVRSRLTGDRDVPAAFPGLVDLPVWQRAQARFGRPRQQHRAHRPEFPLVGLAYCAACGWKMKAAFCSGRHGKRYGYYDCRCGAVRVRMEVVDAFVLQILANDLSGLAADLRRLVLQEATAEADVGRAERDQAQRRLSQAESRLSRLTDAYADGALPAQEYRAKAAEYRREMADARVDAESLQGGIDALLGSLDKLVDVLSRPAEIWRGLDVAGKKTMARVLFGRIELSPDGTCRTANKEGVINGLTAVNDAQKSDGAPVESAIETAVKIVEAFRPLQAVIAA